jgi:hypothetical protein
MNLCVKSLDFSSSLSFIFFIFFLFYFVGKINDSFTICYYRQISKIYRVRHLDTEADIQLLIFVVPQPKLHIGVFWRRQYTSQK